MHSQTLHQKSTALFGLNIGVIKAGNSILRFDSTSNLVG